MFAQHGYAGVGIDDIGEAAGIGGASIYTYFNNKADLLETALDRGTALLYLGPRQRVAEAVGAHEALEQLIASYLRFAFTNHDLLDLLITGTEHLPEERRHDIRQWQSQRSYVDVWVHLSRMIHPELDVTGTRVRMHAALTLKETLHCRLTGRRSGRPHLPRMPASTATSAHMNPGCCRVRQSTTSKVIPAFCSRASRFFPIAAAGVTCPEVSGLASNARQSADSPSIFAVSV